MPEYEKPNERQRRYAAAGAASLQILYGTAFAEGTARLGPDVYVESMAGHLRRLEYERSLAQEQVESDPVPTTVRAKERPVLVAMPLSLEGHLTPVA